MAVTTVENFSKVIKYDRLDAKFFDPIYKIDFSRGRWVKLEDYLEIVQYGISQAMEEEEIGYPIFRMDDIKNGFLLNYEVKYLETDDDVFERFKLELNDVLFNRVNSEEFVGRTGIFKLEGDYIFASYLIRLRTLHGSEITPDYLNLFLNTKFGRMQIDRYSRRSVNQANVNAEELKNFKIAIVPTEIQEQIADLSDEIWEKIKVSKELFEEAKLLLINELGLENYEFEIDQYTVSNLTESIEFNRLDAQYFQPAYEDLLNQIRNYENGYTNLLTVVENVAANFNPDPESIYKYIELANIDASIGVIDVPQTISGDDLPSRAKRILEINDVLASSVEGSLEKIALVNNENEGFIASNGFFQFRSNDIKPEVLLVFLNTFIMHWQFKRECTGTILTAVPKDSLRRIIIPNLSEQIEEDIVNLVQDSHSKREEAEKLLKTAKEIVESTIEQF